jgi:hypothetical protein
MRSLGSTTQNWNPWAGPSPVNKIVIKRVPSTCMLVNRDSGWSRGVVTGADDHREALSSCHLRAESYPKSAICPIRNTGTLVMCEKVYFSG